MPATFREAIEAHWARASRYPGPRVGELLLVQSPTVRRLLRSVSSGQAALTDAAALVVGLAWLHPQRLTNDQSATDYLEAARLRKTFSSPAAKHARCMVLATRSMAALDQAASQCGFDTQWITEGLEMDQVTEILAIPADHAVLGLVAIHVPAGYGLAADEFCWEGFMVNGFGGSWPKSLLTSGHSPADGLG